MHRILYLCLALMALGVLVVAYALLIYDGQ